MKIGRDETWVQEVRGIVQGRELGMDELEGVRDVERICSVCLYIEEMCDGVGI